MTTRRGFIAGLLASAAIPPVGPGDGVALFSVANPAIDIAAPGADQTAWFLISPGQVVPRTVYWSSAPDVSDWSTEPFRYRLRDIRDVMNRPGPGDTIFVSSGDDTI